MFPFFPLFPEPVRIKAEPVRRLGSPGPLRSLSQSGICAQAAAVNAHLRGAAKSAFRLTGED